MHPRRVAAALALALTSAAAPAAGLVEPPGGHDRLEALGGDALRVERTLRHGRAPARLAGEVGGRARASFDAATGVPSRVWGAGVPVPRGAQVAHARAVLERNLAVLAPGAALDDLELVTDHEGRGATGAPLRTIAFAQRAGGVPVVGGQVSFRFVADRLVLVASEASPFARAGRVTVDPAAARAAAEAALADVAELAEASAVEGPFVLPLVSASGAVRHATALRVEVDTAPIGRWHVWIDAATGAPVARQQTLRFDAGAVTLNVPERWPGAGRKPYPMQRANVLVDGASSQSDVAGGLTWASGAPASVELQLVGPWLDVINDDGPDATLSIALPPGGAFEWNAGADPPTDAQLSIFVHLQLAKERALSISPGFDFPFQSIEAHANVQMSCNSYSDGTNVFLFRAGFGCENMGRIADVVYHEYGHSVHAHAIILGVGAFDGALSEGVSDYLAATMNDDSGMGRGFFMSPEPLRELDPPGYEHQWPIDVHPDVHQTGLIIGGALWDLRELLTAELGAAEGVALADRLYFEGHRRAVDIPTVYHEVLVADDDDGDLSNGTPHVCEIDEAFAPHGLKAIGGSVPELGPAAASADGYEVTATVDGLFPQCAGQDAPVARLRHRRRGKPQDTTEVVMTETGPGAWSALIPPQPDGTLVEYQVEIDVGPAGVHRFPANPADPWYQLWVGPTVPLYCTDFEGVDPEEEGWTHGFDFADPSEPLPDDWRWGPVNAKPGSGDPPTEFSGARVFGNDLGGAGKDGNYPPHVKNWARTPDVDVQGYSGVRLQYRRWLNVQAGFADRAWIGANGTTVWDNDGDVDHRDGEWRFHDVDLSARVKQGKVRVEFGIESNQDVQLGGWTLDDVCVVGWDAPPPLPVCGNAILEEGEACDGGVANSDVTPGACRTDCRFAHCGDGVVDGGEACDDGNDADGDGCSSACDEEGPPSGASVEGGCACGVAGGGRAARGLAALGLAALAAVRRRSRVRPR